MEIINACGEDYMIGPNDVTVIKKTLTLIYQCTLVHVSVLTLFRGKGVRKQNSADLQNEELIVIA